MCRIYPHTEIDNTVELLDSSLTHFSILKAKVDINHTAGSTKKIQTEGLNQFCDEIPLEPGN